MSDAPEPLEDEHLKAPVVDIHLDVDTETLVVPDSALMLSHLRDGYPRAGVRTFTKDDCERYGELLYAALASLPKEMRYGMHLKRTANRTDGVKQSDELIYWKGRVVARRSQTRFDYGPSVATTSTRSVFRDDLKAAKWRKSAIGSEIWFAPLDMIELMPPLVVHERNKTLYNHPDVLVSSRK